MPLLVRWLHAHFIQLQDWYQQSLPIIVAVELFIVTAQSTFLLNFSSFLLGSLRVAIFPCRQEITLLTFNPFTRGRSIPRPSALLVWHCNIPSDRVGCIIFTDIFCILHGFHQPAFFIIFPVRGSNTLLPPYHTSRPNTHVNTRYFIRLGRRRHSCESLLWHPAERCFRPTRGQVSHGLAPSHGLHIHSRQLPSHLRFP